jgi:glycosyltransferase involved in cell wall biosynthesis
MQGLGAGPTPSDADGVGRRPTPRVLLVGQGEPAKGGIPSFIRSLLDAPDLRSTARLSYLNTTRDPTRPGGATLDNLRWTVQDLRRVHDAARGVDVVHLNLAPAPLLPLLRAIALAAAARSAGARALVHAHSGRLHVAARARSYRLLLGALVRVSDAIVVVSADGAATIRAAGGRPTLLPNAVDASSFVHTGHDDPRTVITFVGTVCERKGLDDLRRALLRLVEVDAAGPDRTRIVIVGDGRQEGPGVFERVRDAYERSGLGWVEFTGALPPEEVRRVLTSSDVFCLPSHWEGLPLSLLEAMASGTAVVASNVGDIPDALAGGDAGILVPVKDVEALAGALGLLLREPATRARLARAARDRIESSFDRPTMTERLAALYRELTYSM